LCFDECFFKGQTSEFQSVSVFFEKNNTGYEQSYAQSRYSCDSKCGSSQRITEPKNEREG